MDFKALFSQLIIQFNALSKAQRLVIVGAVVGIVAFLIFLVVYTGGASKDNDYKVLFDNLSPSDAAVIIEQLEKDGIPYQLPNEKTIEVPKDVVYKERIAIASQGIPSTKGVGFSLFDEQEFGATNFDQNVKYQRALQGELASTIMALKPVETATVSLAIPKKTLFVAKKPKTTASVMLKLRPESKLTNKQVSGIKNLVAAAVPELSPDDVTVVNSEGETLGADDEFTQLSEMTVMEQAYKKRIESQLEKNIVNVIAPYIGGVDRVVAKVNIDFDFSRTDSESEMFDPENVVRSEQTLEEKREGVTPEVVGGVPGAVSNIGPVEGLETQQGKDSYEKATTTTNYEVSKTIRKTKGQFAKIERITAAVVVDGKYTSKLDEDGYATGEKEYAPLSEEELNKLRALAETAIGIDTERGDKVTVENLQFQSAMFEMTGPWDEVKQFVELYLQPLFPIFNWIAIIIILFIAYKKIIKPFSERMLEVTREEEDLDEPMLEIADEEQDDVVQRAQQMRKRVEEQLGLGDNMNEDELKHDVLLEKIRTICEERTDEVAQLLQTLVNEEQEHGQTPNKFGG